jgi:carbon starvation protein CstA
MRILWAALRIVFAIAIGAAIVFQLAATVGKATADGRSEALVITNFFSYFTIDSNALAVVTLIIGAVLLIRGKGDDPQWFATLRLCMTTYMVVTGIVYNLLLRNVEVTAGAEAIPWSNEVLHFIGPIYLALDWLLAPGRIALPYWRSIRIVVIFPIAWAVYTLIRGPLVPNELTGADYWYPYPFLDPHNSPNGYLSVSFYVILIAVIIGLVAASAIWISRRKLVTILPGQPQPVGALPKG